MQYIALLDYHHLDHSFFMKLFAESMALQKDCSGIILHGDSAYTDRLIQTGMLREDAVVRSTKDLNHRIIALLADNGIAGIGVNGYQKNIIRRKGEQLIVHNKWIEERPPGTHLVISNLVMDESQQMPVPVPLNNMAATLSKQLDCDTIILFPNNDTDDFVIRNDILLSAKNKSNNEKELSHRIPDDLKPLPDYCYLCSTMDFGKLPDRSGLQDISI